jgi:aspartate/methionine/tyrosine aminotransferase
LAKKLSTAKWPLTEDEVILTMGGSGALFHSVNALAAPGDKILMSKPAFPLMRAFTDFLGISVLEYDLHEGDWQPNVQQIDELLT